MESKVNVKNRPLPTGNSFQPNPPAQQKPEQMDHILVIDDDRELVHLLQEYLVPEGFTINAAFDHATALAKALSGDEELIVLDVMLPGGSGFELLKQLRKMKCSKPVLLLTARGEVEDRLIGLETGADDYMAKPFDPRELLARIRTILRRTRAAQEPGAQTKDITVGDVSLSPSTRSVTCSGNQVDLTSVEFNVLDILLHHAGKVVTREDLSELALGRPLSPFDRSIDVHVSKLRRKLGGGEDSESKIKTIRGEGYIYTAHVHRSQS
jgi:DNA-binding response OmpR family regulator